MNNQKLLDFLKSRHACEESLVSGIFDMSKSGAVLTWERFNPGKKPPRLIEHIQDRDLWEFKLKGTREVISALISYDFNFEIWDHLMNKPEMLRLEGISINRNDMTQIKRHVKSSAARIKLDEFDIPVINAPFMWASECGNILAKNEPFAATYCCKKDIVVFSLRSEKQGVDVSDIAKRFGGGGHQHSAGFTLQLNDFNLVKIQSKQEG